MASIAALTDSGSPTDVELLRFAQALEQVLIRAYQVVTPMLVSTAAVQTAAAFGRHHADHATALARTFAPALAGPPNRALLNEVLGPIQAAKNEHDALTALYELETNAASTDQYLLEHLLGDDSIRQVSSILPVEGQHAVILGMLVQKEVKDVVPAFQKSEGHYDPVRFAGP